MQWALLMIRMPIYMKSMEKLHEQICGISLAEMKILSFILIHMLLATTNASLLKLSRSL